MCLVLNVSQCQVRYRSVFTEKVLEGLVAQVDYELSANYWFHNKYWYFHKGFGNGFFFLCWWNQFTLNMIASPSFSSWAYHDYSAVKNVIGVECFGVEWYLVLLLASDLTWSQHIAIDSICLKAKKILGLYYCTGAITTMQTVMSWNNYFL